MEIEIQGIKIEAINTELYETDAPMLSIWCNTYNHGSFIKNTFRGFLSQKTTFPYEIIFFDDSSVDGTSEIIKDICREYPNQVIAYIAKENTYQKSERYSLVSSIKKTALRGSYIALCEGDDFWIDPQKLEIQVKYLESNPECTLFVHNAIWMEPSNDMYAGDPYETNEDRYIEPCEIIVQSRKHPPTASFVFRSVVLDMPTFFTKTPVFDYSVQLYALSLGKIYYSSRIMSVYRYQHSGSYNAKLDSDYLFAFQFYVGVIDFLVLYNTYTKNRFYDSIRIKVQSFFTACVERMETNVSTIEHINRCIDRGLLMAEHGEGYIDCLDSLKKQIKDETWISDETRLFLQDAERIFIMGTGNYGEKLLHQLQNENIHVEGFINSHKNTVNFHNYKVWEIGEIDFKLSDKVLIGINPVYQYELGEILENAGTRAFFNPFDVREYGVMVNGGLCE